MQVPANEGFGNNHKARLFCGLHDQSGFNYEETMKFSSIPKIQDRALRKLRQLDAALTLEDLRNPPSNNLENLKGDKKGPMSIRINNQWRLCFHWYDGEATEVEVVDYH
jgi:toxin HigB-1